MLLLAIVMEPDLVVQRRQRMMQQPPVPVLRPRRGGRAPNPARPGQSDSDARRRCCSALRAAAGSAAGARVLSGRHAAPEGHEGGTSRSLTDERSLEDSAPRPARPQRSAGPAHCPRARRGRPDAQSSTAAQPLPALMRGCLLLQGQHLAPTSRDNSEQSGIWNRCCSAPPSAPAAQPLLHARRAACGVRWPYRNYHVRARLQDYRLYCLQLSPRACDDLSRGFGVMATRAQCCAQGGWRGRATTTCRSPCTSTERSGALRSRECV